MIHRGGVSAKYRSLQHSSPLGLVRCVDLPPGCSQFPASGRVRPGRTPQGPTEFTHSRDSSMPQYTPPLRDMQFVLHEMLNV
ncbi:MAG: acyl-CoA dehydrogenase N-terminal domain-containing protein, partial [Abyssibacter sp.]|nr:acyl-CoA dehydrogenase N-terminal domain-containing protein [Abyssibacter sp.]